MPHATTSGSVAPSGHTKPLSPRISQALEFTKVFAKVRLEEPIQTFRARAREVTEAKLGRGPTSEQLSRRRSMPKTAQGELQRPIVAPCIGRLAHSFGDAPARQLPSES